MKRREKKEMKGRWGRASCASENVKPIEESEWRREGGEKMEYGESRGRGVWERDGEIVGYFRIQSRIRDKVGSDRSQHTSTLAVNSKLCVAFLSHSDAPPPNHHHPPFSPSHLSLLLISLPLSFSFSATAPLCYCFTLKAGLSARSWSFRRSVNNNIPKAPGAGYVLFRGYAN